MAYITQDSQRYILGKYRGTVVDNNDPDKLGRVKLQVPSLFQERTHHAWAEPSFPTTELFLIPPIGSQVWVEFEEGDPDSPIWSGCFLRSDQPHTEAKDGSPKARSLKTEQSLELTLDDNVKEIHIKVNNNTKILIKQDSNKIVVDAESVEIGEGASHPIVLGDLLQSLFNAHTHPYTDDGSPAVTGTPIIPMSATQLSAKHKVE